MSETWRRRAGGVLVAATWLAAGTVAGQEAGSGATGTESPSAVSAAETSEATTAQAKSAGASASGDLAVTVGAYTVSRHLPFGFAGPSGYLIAPFVSIQRGDRLRLTLNSVHYTAANGELGAFGVAAVALDVGFLTTLGPALDVELGYQLFTAPGFDVARSQAFVVGFGAQLEATRASVELLYDFEVGSGLLATLWLSHELRAVDIFLNLGYNHGYYHDGSAPSHALVGVGLPLSLGDGGHLRPELTYTHPLGDDFAGGLALGLTVSLTPGR